MSDAARDKHDVTPDSLIAHFKGKGIASMVVFTVVVHAVVLIGSSVPFLVESVLGADHSKLSEEARVKSAVEDVTAALRKIAEKHGLNPQDISSQFAGGGSRMAKPDALPETGGVEPPPKEPEREKSDYEKTLEVKTNGPAMPTFEDEDDIF